MTNLDQAIRQALSAEDAEFLARFEKEDSLQGQVLGAFSGQFRWLSIFAAVLSFALFGLFVYCAWSMIEAADLRETVLWGVGAVLTSSAVAMLKMWFWMEMHKNQMLREVKRLELQVARVASRGAV